jgi:hypothetical protein
MPACPSAVNRFAEVNISSCTHRYLEKGVRRSSHTMGIFSRQHHNP